MSMVRVLVVPADVEEAARVVVVESTHEVLCGLVGDVNTDTVFLRETAGLVKVAANGKSLASHGANPRATQVVERFVPGFAKRDRVEGAAVFTGLAEDGDVGDVSESVVEFVAEMFGVDASV